MKVVRQKNLSLPYFEEEKQSVMDVKKTEYKKLRNIHNSLRGCIVFGINAASGVLVRTCFNVDR